MYFSYEGVFDVGGYQALLTCAANVVIIININAIFYRCMLLLLKYKATRMIV